MENQSVLQNENSAIAQVGEHGYLLVSRATPKSDQPYSKWPEGHVPYQWKLLDKSGHTFCASRTGSMIVTGAAGLGDDPVKVMSSLVSFLLAFAESRSSTSENWDLFPRRVHPWADRASDDLTTLSMVLNDEDDDAEGWEYVAGRGWVQRD